MCTAGGGVLYAVIDWFNFLPPNNPPFHLCGGDQMSKLRGIEVPSIKAKDNSCKEQQEEQQPYP